MTLNCTIVSNTSTARLKENSARREKAREGVCGDEEGRTSKSRRIGKGKVGGSGEGENYRFEETG